MFACTGADACLEDWAGHAAVQCCSCLCPQLRHLPADRQDISTDNECCWSGQGRGVGVPVSYSVWVSG